MSDLARALLDALRPAYPDLEVGVRPWPDDPSRTEVTFVTARFRGLYLRQRYHGLVHALPGVLYDRHLADAVFVELAPGESREEAAALDLDDEHVASIERMVLDVLERDDFPRHLAAALARTPCRHDFAASRALLVELGHPSRVAIDACHVFMRNGGFCDCEVVDNVFREAT